jgi:hypothetical protein
MNDEIEKREEKSERSIEVGFDTDNWIVGLALILVGGLFLLDSFNLVNINLVNWWAVFILIPGLSMTIKGWRRYQEDQSTSSRNSGMWGMALILMAFAFLFNISWNLIFPAFLIGAGAYLLFFR